MKKARTTWFSIFFLTVISLLVPAQKVSAVVLADIVFVFDESSSMNDEQEDVINNLHIFTQALIDAGIDAQFGLVGFGWASTTNPSPFIREVTDLTNPAGLTTGLNDLHEIGSLEYGFQATKFALDNISWRTGAVKNIIFISDEDSDGTESGADAALTAFGALWNGIINFDDYDGPAGNYGTLAHAHGGEIFDIHAFNADPTGFFTFFSQFKVKEILDNGGGQDPVIPEPASLLLMGGGLLAAMCFKRKRLS